jgi:hypothetical protein
VLEISKLFKDKCKNKNKNYGDFLRYITYGIREKVTTLGLKRATLIA